MYDRILLPTDGGDSRRTTAQAIELADAVDATIHAIHVINERAYESLDADEREARDAAATDALAAVRAAAPDDVAVETERRYGIVHRELLAAAEAADADAIVMGTRGRTGLDRLLAGDRAELIVREATIPVLTVDSSDGAASSARADGPLARVKTTLGTISHGLADALADPYRVTASWLESYRDAVEAAAAPSASDSSDTERSDRRVSTRPANPGAESAPPRRNRPTPETDR